MKKRIQTILVLSVIFLLSGNAFAQEEEEPDMSPVRSPFESGLLIDKQTMQIPYKNTLEFQIHHRFGTLGNGVSDMFGLYAPSNIRLGLNYSLSDDFMVGMGATKGKKYTDLQAKYNVLKQTRGGTVPVSVTLYGNAAIDGRSEDMLGEEFSLYNRLVYFGEIIVSHKFDYYFSLQASASFSHANKVREGYEHDKAAASVAGKYRVSAQSSIIANTEFPLHIEGMQENVPLNIEPEPNLGVGWEISTATHVFQVFVANGYGIINQENVMYNQNDFSDDGWLIGFNITRLWSF
ncbi:MAG: DUF5777 family beta-barrel protein [Bacteroidales bacterium]|nr:DUF5777 family beta-barrel protein [Bacteroidales bacterium]MCF8338265.1 DUF5777 family beta-barrel protein [Bacteroidales bacterium]